MKGMMFIRLFVAAVVLLMFLFIWSALRRQRQLDDEDARQEKGRAS